MGLWEVALDHHVLGLQIAVHDVLAVQILDALGDLEEHLEPGDEREDKPDTKTTKTARTSSKPVASRKSKAR